MIVVPSTLSGVLNDLPRYVKESEDVMGYIICDRVAILSKGKLLAVGEIEQIKQSAKAQTFEDAFISLVESANE